MSDLKNRLEQFRKELDSSIDAAKGNCNKVAFENFTDDLKELDNIIRDLANGVPTGEKQCNLPVVVQQRELLIGLTEYITNRSWLTKQNHEAGKIVDDYLANL